MKRDRSKEYAARIRTGTYRSRDCAIQRCHNPKNQDYANYGGRGIKVCDRWRGQEGFKNFLEDMGERPAGLTLDRKEVNGDYCKENCKWATLSEQNKNQRRWTETVTPEMIEREKTCEEIGINL